MRNIGIDADNNDEIWAPLWQVGLKAQISLSVYRAINKSGY